MVFSFILKTKHKTLHVKRAWAELEKSAEKQSAQASIDRVQFSIDRARQIYIINPAATQVQLYIQPHTLSKSKQD